MSVLRRISNRRSESSPSPTGMRHRVVSRNLIKDAALDDPGEEVQDETKRRKPTAANRLQEDKDSDVASLLSRPESESVWDSDDEARGDDTQFEEHEAMGDLLRLEAKFARRDRILDRISQGKSRSFIELLRRHEQEVRVDERERLLLRLLYTRKSSARSQSIVGQSGRSKNRDLPASLNTESGLLNCDLKVARDHIETLIDCSESKARRNRSYFGVLQDHITYEMSSIVPAVASFVLHTLLEYLMYEITSFFVTLGRRNLNMKEDRLILGVFVLGLTLVRLSGYLYWWLNNRDYNCVKFEFHNRLRLQTLDAQVLRWIREHEYTRCVVFVIGYYLCFISIIHFYYRFANLWDESETLLKDLPSSQLQSKFCPADWSPLNIQHNLDQLDEQQEAIRIADKWYTWSVLSTRSYELYWIEKGDGIGLYGYPFLSQTREVLLMTSLASLSLAFLTWYGFIYWRKY